MAGFGTTELLIILAIVLLLFGASRLPAIGHGLGKSISGFKRAMNGASDGTPSSLDAVPEEDKS